MANPNIQGVIPLDGAGFVKRPYGKLTPGEYRRLLNAEISDDGALINRPSLKLYNPTIITDPRYFMGGYQSWATIKTGAWNSLFFDKTAGLTAVAITGAAATQELFRYHFYNGKHYWIGLKSVYDTISTGYTVSVELHHAFYSSGFLWTPLDIPVTYAGYTHTNVFTDNLKLASGLMAIKNSFIFKDRMWIITNNKIFWSKATDPTVWTAPDGGSFQIDERDTVNYAVAIKDSVYIVCDSSVYLFTYNADPATDGTLTLLSDSIGSDNATVFQGAVWFLDRDTLYTIQNGFISKVRDLHLDLNTNLNDVNINLIAFGKYLLVAARKLYGSFQGPIDYNTAYSILSSPTSYYLINSDNGCISEFQFMDNREAVGSQNWGRPIDFYVPTKEDSSGFNQMLVLTRQPASNQGYLYAVSPESYAAGLIDPFDEVKYSGATKLQTPDVLVEIENYVPDGNQLNMKVFRTLFVEGKIPEDISLALKLLFKFGLNTSSAQTDVYHAPLSSTEIPTNGYRYGVMQRSRGLGVQLRRDAVVNLTPGSTVRSSFIFKIANLITMWSYTKRQPANNLATTSS